MKILHERGDVNPNSVDNSGRTPLSYAAHEGYESVVKILLERGEVNPNSADKSGRTPLSYAAEKAHGGSSGASLFASSTTFCFLFLLFNLFLCPQLPSNIIVYHFVRSDSILETPLLEKSHSQSFGHL